MSEITWQFIVAIGAVTAALVFVFRLYVHRVESENKRVWALYESHTTELKERIQFLESEQVRLNKLITKFAFAKAGIEIDGD